ATRSGRVRLAKVIASIAIVVAGLAAWAALAGGVQPHDRYEGIVTRDEPVAQFPFDDSAGESTISDVVGSHSYSASNGGVALGQSGPFVGSHSGGFGGSAFATLAGNPLSGATEFTFETWVNWAGGTSGQPIMGIGSGTGSYMYLTPSSVATKHPIQFEI